MNNAQILPYDAALVDDGLRILRVPNPAGARRFVSPRLRIRCVDRSVICRVLREAMGASNDRAAWSLDCQPVCA